MAEKKSITLVHNGALRFTLDRLPRQGAEKIIEPADELVTYLERCFGETPTHFDDSKPLRITLNLAPRSGLDREEFVIRTTAQGVELRAATVQAMFHAVYTFLDRVIGVRWLWPGISGEVVPRRKTLRIPTGTIREKPDWTWRQIGLGGAVYGQAGGLDYATMLHTILDLPLNYQEEFDRWCRRNRLGGENIDDGHRWHEIAPPERFGRKHPDWYALVDGERDCKPHDGKHGAQPCLANPEVIDLVADYACAQFEADSALDACSISLNDGGGSCECKQCREVDRKAGAGEMESVGHFDLVTQEARGKRQTLSITDRFFWFLQQVAEKVSARFPDRKMLVQLYSDYRRPPVTFDLPESIIGQYCVMGNMFCDDAHRKSELGRIREMGRHAPTMGIYEYYSNGKWPEVHRLIPSLIEDSVREYHRAGARYFATQPSTGFAANGLNFYLLTRLLWDTKAEVDGVIDDYCRAAFGKARTSLRRFFDAFAQRWIDTRATLELPRHPEPRLAIGHLYDRPFIAARRKELAAAKRTVADDAGAAERIEFVERGLNYTALYCEAVRATEAVYAADDEEGLSVDAPSPAMRNAAKDAVEAWDRYWQFVKENSAEYVYGDFWVNYRPGPQGRDDATLARLRELAD